MPSHLELWRDKQDPNRVLRRAAAGAAAGAAKRAHCAECGPLARDEPSAHLAGCARGLSPVEPADECPTCGHDDDHEEGPAGGECAICAADDGPCRPERWDR